jgi:CheY-like chemotaxis protein
MIFEWMDTVRRGWARSPLVGMSLFLLVAMWQSGRARRLALDGHAADQLKAVRRDQASNRQGGPGSSRLSEHRIKSVGHDMRNRLSAISYAVGVLRRGPASDVAADACAIIERQSAHLSQAVTEMLALAPVSTQRPGAAGQAPLRAGSDKADSDAPVLAGASSHSPADARPMQAKGQSDAAASTGATLPCALLIGHDADAMGKPLKILLQTGCKVSCVMQDEAGLRALLEQRPDVTVIDIGPNAADGVDIATRARAAGYAGRLVAWSPAADEGDARASLRAGFDAHLGNPLRADALLHELEQVR